MATGECAATAHIIHTQSPEMNEWLSLLFPWIVATTNNNSNCLHSIIIIYYQLNLGVSRVRMLQVASDSFGRV